MNRDRVLAEQSREWVRGMRMALEALVMHGEEAKEEREMRQEEGGRKTNSSHLVMSGAAGRSNQFTPLKYS
eukprot:760749-Hanusia_phi.AAC.2